MTSPTTPQPLKGVFHSIEAVNGGEHVDLVMRFPRGKAPSIYTPYQLIPLDASHQPAGEILERMAMAMCIGAKFDPPKTSEATRAYFRAQALAAFRALTEEGK